MYQAVCGKVSRTLTTYGLKFHHNKAMFKMFIYQQQPAHDIILENDFIKPKYIVVY
jgi:hypothetical protein